MEEPLPALLRDRLRSAGPPRVADALRAGLARPPVDEPDATAVLHEAVDPSNARPKLADDVEVRIFRLRWGNDYAMIANPRTLTHFQIEVWEAELASTMDGTRTVGEIVVDHLDGSGDLDPNAVTELVYFLHKEGLLDPQPPDVPALVAARLAPPAGLRQRLASFMKTLRVDWSGADGHVRWWYRTLLRPLFSPAGAVVTALVALGGFAAFLVANASGRYSLKATEAPLDSLILLALSFVLTYAHELGHAISVVHYGRRIKSAGFMLYFGSPAFFVDVSDGLMLERGPRILESALGPYAEMLLAGIGSFSLLLWPDAGVAPLIWKFALLNYLLIFENLIPLLELDGYFILSEAIEVPDLRERSLQFIQHDAWHKLRARERFSKQEVALGVYSVIGVAFTILSVYLAIFFWKEIFGGLITGLWDGGVPTRLLLLALALLLAGPAIRGLITLARTTARRIRFKFETSWRVEAAEMIDALPAFDELSGELLSDLAGRVKLVGYRPGEPVFRQGDRPTAFYVVRRGTLRVEEEDPESGDVTVLRTIGRGDSFGELALLQSAPRSATVRADDEVELFEVDRPTFDRLLADAIDAPTFALTLQTLAELRELPAFSTLGTEGLADLLEHGSWVTAAPGDVVVEQGAPGDAFYAIRSGQADVLRDGEHLRSLGPGAHFGEIALLRDVPRTASVVARTPLRAFRLDREGFDRVIRESFRQGTLKPAADKTWQH